MIKEFKIAGLRYITIFMTAEICYFSTHIIPPVTVVTDHKTQFFTHFHKKIQKIFDYFKCLLMTHHLDIFMSGNNLGLNGLIKQMQNSRALVLLLHNEQCNDGICCSDCYVEYHCIV